MQEKIVHELIPMQLNSVLQNEALNLAAMDCTLLLMFVSKKKIKINFEASLIYDNLVHHRNGITTLNTNFLLLGIKY